MKGIVFNLLEHVIREEHGESTWDALLEASQVKGSYTSLGSYPDSELMQIVAAASSALDTPADEVVRWFGRRALPVLASRYPKFFERASCARSFVLSLNHIIHPEVRKLYPGADVPEFDFDTSSDTVLVMGYRSARKLCAFAEGLIAGAADHYGEEVEIGHPSCMHRGDEKCVLRISFAKR